MCPCTERLRCKLFRAVLLFFISLYTHTHTHARAHIHIHGSSSSSDDDEDNNSNSAVNGDFPREAQVLSVCSEASNP